VSLTTSGAPDLGFGGGDGIVTTDTGVSELGHVVVPLSSSAIFVSGRVGGDLAALRYSSLGVLDSSFDGDGIAIVSATAPDADFVGLALQSNGKLVLSSKDTPGANDDFVVARLDGTTGALDAGFGTGGVVTTDFGATPDLGLGCLVQPDGKIVVAGTAGSGSAGNLALARYDGDPGAGPTATPGGPTATPTPVSTATPTTTTTPTPSATATPPCPLSPIPCRTPAVAAKAFIQTKDRARTTRTSCSGSGSRDRRPTRPTSAARTSSRR
jgi:uncharacterized delta-60 repeat protein